MTVRSGESPDQTAVRRMYAATEPSPAVRETAEP
jgi:hypothetical protein